jgi:hypothetical protein
MLMTVCRLGSRVSGALCLALALLGAASYNSAVYANSGKADTCTGCTFSCAGQINGTNCNDDRGDANCSLTCQCQVNNCKIVTP